MPGDHGRGANRVVRPYAITRGRTRPARADLELEALVFADPSALAGSDLGDERRAIVLICTEVLSVAEISADLAIPVGVTRVLVADMVADGLVHLHRPEVRATAPTSPCWSGSWRACGRSDPPGRGLRGGRRGRPGRGWSRSGRSRARWSGA